MSTALGVLFSLALVAAPVVILISLKKAGRRALEAVCQRLGLQIGPNSIATVGAGVYKGRALWVQNMRPNRTWVVELEARVPGPPSFSLLRRDWQRGWDERLVHGTEVPLQDPALGESYVLRSKAPEVAEQLFRHDGLRAALRHGASLVYSLQPLEAGEDPYDPFPSKPMRVRGTLWYGASGVPDTEKVLAVVAAIEEVVVALEDAAGAGNPDPV